MSVVIVYTSAAFGAFCAAAMGIYPVVYASAMVMTAETPVKDEKSWKFACLVAAGIVGCICAGVLCGTLGGLLVRGTVLLADSNSN